MRNLRSRFKVGVVLAGALALLGAYPGVSSGQAPSEHDVWTAMEDVRVRVDAINDADDVPEVVQNLIPGAIERRNVAIAQYKAAQSPPAFSKPEYAVVWAGKNNAGDMNGNYVMRFVTQGQLSPASLREVAPLQLMPGLDAMVVVDVRRLNVDGSPNPDYGTVVNLVQVPAPFGVEGEPHHLQYEWLPGQPVVAGHLFTDLTTIWDVSDIPNIKLQNTIRPEENPQGTLPDAYDFAGDLALGTYMGGPDIPNYGGSPGSIVVFKPDSSKGMVQASETPASQFGAVFRGNPNGTPEPCTPLEGRPAGTCGNPHGIQARPDLNVMVTNDYADARELGSDPIKTVEEHAFRPTSRVWDISDPLHPKLVSVAHMPENVVKSPNRAHNNLGIMEGAKTYGDAKGFFSGSMCGGGIFFLPDATNVQPDSSSQWKQVFHDAIAEIGVTGRDINGAGNEQGIEPGACSGGAWHQVSADNRFLFRAMGGRNPGSTNVYDNGAPKMIWVANVENLVKSSLDGSVDCSLDSAREVGQGHGDEADCPTLASTLLVDDVTTGGPHWGALDNHNYRADGAPTRVMFCNYFVARTGYDGNHRCYMANVDPDTGALSYDTGFRDEYTGALGVDFNRRDWPGHSNGGFYKPHSMVFVTPTAAG